MIGCTVLPVLAINMGYGMGEAAVPLLKNDSLSMFQSVGDSAGSNQSFHTLPCMSPI